MDLAVRKLQLMEQFINIVSIDKIEKLEQFFKKEIVDDKDVVLSKLIEKSKKDSKLGRIKTNEEVFKKVKEKYNITL